MVQEGLHVPYRVDRIAWGIALGSLIILAAVIGTLLYLSFDIYRNLYVSRIEATVANHQYKEAQAYLTPLFRGPPILNSFSREGASGNQGAKDVASAYLQIMESLSPKTLPAAQSRLERIHRDLLASTEFPQEAKDILKQLQAPLDGAAALERQLESLIRQRSEIFSRTADARTQFDLLAKDTSELFSLPPESVAAQGDAPAFYTGGVLADLPALEGLPDSIPSLEELKAALSKAGGSVKLQGEDIQNLFAEKLQSLRGSGASLRQTLESSQSSISSTDREISTLSNQLDREVGALSDRFTSAFSELLPLLSDPQR